MKGRPAIGEPAGKYGKYSKRQLVKKLDLVFSQWVKMNERLPIGAWSCVTCGTMYASRDQIQSGHFIPRGYYATRWDEMNVHTQCKRCNGMRAGEWLKYEFYLVEKYGRKEIEAMKSRALIGGGIMPPKEVLIDKIEFYSKALEALGGYDGNEEKKAKKRG